MNQDCVNSSAIPMAAKGVVPSLPRCAHNVASDLAVSLAASLGCAAAATALWPSSSVRVGANPSSVSPRRASAQALETRHGIFWEHPPHAPAQLLGTGNRKPGQIFLQRVVAEAVAGVEYGIGHI